MTPKLDTHVLYNPAIPKEFFNCFWVAGGLRLRIASLLMGKNLFSPHEDEIQVFNWEGGGWYLGI